MVPAPLDVIAEAAGIRHVVDISDLPPEILAKKPSFLGRVLGGLVYGERTVYLDRTGTEPRIRFTQAHEIAHDLIDWHEDSHRLDDYGRLFREGREVVETEANLGAAHLLFQGQVFMQRALDFRLALDAPLALADDFEASRHATIRYYVEHHPDRVAVAVGGRYLRSGCVPIWSGLESVSFRARYGSIKTLLGNRLAAVEGSEIGDIVAEALGSSNVVRGKVKVTDRSGHARGLTAEAFFNQHCTFLLLAETGWIPIGKRIVVATSMPDQFARPVA